MAISKYGIENFKIEEIEKCEIDRLNEREIYWISYYDSYNKGYNATLGGEGNKLYNLNENNVILKYKELNNITKVADFFNCSDNIISNILNKHNIQIKTAVELAKERGFYTYALDDNKNIVQEFNTLYEAGEWVFNNCSHNAKDAHSCKKSILRGILTKTKIYGYYWESENYSEEYIRDYILRKKKSYENYNKKLLKNTIDLNKKLNNKSSLENLNILKNIKNIKNKKIIIPIKELCPLCNKNLKLKNAIYCIECTNNQKSIEFKSEFESKISKKTLMNLVRTKSFDEIGRIYSVNGNTIKKWCKKYCIPFRKEDIVEISDENWKVECNLSKKEYEAKYINTKKEKPIITDQDIIDKYLELKSLKELEELFHKDRKTIKKILENNNIELFNSNKLKSESMGKIKRCDKETGEVLEVYNSMIEAIDWLENNHKKTTRSNYKKNVNKAVNDKVSNAYGYKWVRK